MNPADDDAYAHLLVACHEVVVRGDGSSAAASLPLDLPDEMAKVLQRRVYCLELLEQCRRDGSTAASVAGNQPTPAVLAAAETLVDPDEDDLSLERLGHFQIIRELGRGGHGIVFLATDEKLGRPVALKVPRPECLVSKQMRRRFLREAHAAARLSHPNLLAIYESGEDGPLCYLASAYCTGPTLSVWLRSQSSPVPERLAAEIVMNLADAVSYAHDRGVLHRDIKPGNVFLDASPSGFVPAEHPAVLYVPKLGDFGLAQLADDVSDATRAGALLGTPAYMAPEQARGQREQIGPATDVYGLGAILLELLTGRPPFEGRSDVDILRQVVVDDAPRLRGMRRGLSADLAAIGSRCLEKLAAKRYASAGDLAADLRRYLAGEPIQARHATAPERLLKWTRRHPTAAALWGVTSAALLTLLVVMVLSNQWLRHERNQTVAALQKSQASERKSRTQVYASEMKLAYDLFRNFDVAQSLELLNKYIPAPGEEDHRDFFWNFMWRALHRQHLRLPRHPGDVYSLAFSPDGTQLATACRDGKTRVWDYKSGQLAFELEGHAGEVRAVTFSPDGTRLVTGGDDGCAIVWNLADRLPLKRFEHADLKDRVVTRVFISPDGNQLYTAAGIHLVAWDMATGVRTKAIEFFNDHHIESASLSPDGRYLAAAVVELKAFRTDNWECVFRAPDAATNRWWAVQFLPDSQHLAVIGDPHVLMILNMNQDKPAFSRQISYTRNRASLAYSPKQDLLAVGFCDNSVVLTASDSKRERDARFVGHTARILDVKFDNDGSSIVSAGADGEVMMWPAAVDARRLFASGAIQAYDSPHKRLRCLSYSPDGRRLVFGGDEDRLRLLDCQTAQIDELPDSGKASVVAFLPDGKNLVFVAPGEGELQLYNLDRRTSKPLAKLSGNQIRVNVSPRGEIIAVACDRSVRLIEVASGSILRSLSAPEAVNSMEFSPSGDRFAVLSSREMEIFDTATWQRLLNIRPSNGHCLDLDFFPDGKRMAIAEGGHGVVIRDVETGRELMQYTGHSGMVDSLAVAPDGVHIASVCDRNVLQIWDARTGQSLMRFEDVQCSPHGIQFSPSGGELAIVQDRPSSNLTLLDGRPVNPPPSPR